MSKFTSTGITLSVAAAQPATEDEAGYAALSYTEILGVTNMPAFGATVNVVESRPLKTGVVEKYKGFINYGSVPVDFDIIEGDAGQALVTAGVTGAEKNTRHSFKLTYQVGALTATRYFQGKFFSDPENPGSADSMVSGSANVEIETAIIKVAAA